MAPTAIFTEPLSDSTAVNIADLKAKAVDGHVEVEVAPPPVADNFMYDFKYNHALPTIDVLGRDIAADCDAEGAAKDILATLEQALTAGDAVKFTEMFLDYGQYSTQISNMIHVYELRCLA